MKSKMKTRSTAAKRFKTSATGKVMREKTGLNHLRRKKSASSLRNLRRGDVLFKGDAARIKLMLGPGIPVAHKAPRPKAEAVETEATVDAVTPTSSTATVSTPEPAPVTPAEVAPETEPTAE